MVGTAAVVFILGVVSSNCCSIRLVRGSQEIGTSVQNELSRDFHLVGTF